MTLLSDSLSAALIHSLWQDAVVGLLAWMVLAGMRQRSAHARYAVACAALALMAVMPVATMAALYTQPLPAADVATTVPSFAVSVSSAGASALGDAPAVISIRDVSWLSTLQTWALPAWLIGVLLFSIRLVSASAHTVALKRRTEPADDTLTSMVATLAARLGVTRRVTVLVSRVTASPATLGWIRPVILLPPATVLGLTTHQLEALVAHELAHVRRHDYAVNVLQMMAETLFFYHPAIWLVSRRIRVERELCCDDIAIEACGDAVGYAKALTQVARLRLQSEGLAMGASSNPLLRRIQRVLGAGYTGNTVSPLWIVVTVLVMMVAILWTGTRAQSSQISTDGAALRGRVIDAATGQPIPGARVRADQQDNPTGVLCPIDDCTCCGFTLYRENAGTDGRFEITGMAPGDYFVMAAAPGYIQRRFGQTAADMPEVTVRAAAGQTPPAFDIRLDRAGLVTGRVFSDAGDGLFGVELELFRRQYVPGGARHMAVAFAQTEAQGVYRFRDVTPGEYYVRAYVPPSIHPTSADKSLTYAATFFPASTSLETAQPLTVANGQELFGIDFPLVTTQMRSVTGRLVDPTGVSLTTATVRLMPVGHGPVEMPESPVTRDGQFRIVGVTPGDYTLLVADSANNRSWNSAIQQISVRDDIKDLVLAAGPSVRVEGRLAREDGTAPPFDVRNLQITLEQHLGQQMDFSSGMTRDVRADGTFAVRAGTGTNYLQIAGLPAPRWNIKRATLDGFDITDEPFDLKGGTSHHLEIVLTDHVVRLTGNVTDRDGRPVSNALVVVFPDDRSKWETSRLIRTTFSHQQGSYDLANIPAASYRAVAVTALPRGAWTDPAVLDRLWPSSVSVRVEEGQRVVALTAVPPPTDLIQ